MKATGSVSVDLLAIYVRGIDAFGSPFDIALDPETAKGLVFKLHRMILEQEEMRKAVNEAGGGRAA